MTTEEVVKFLLSHGYSWNKYFLHYQGTKDNLAVWFCDNKLGIWYPDGSRKFYLLSNLSFNTYLDSIQSIVVEDVL
jgi:hypothetical protein